MLSPRQTVESNLIEKQETASVTQPLGPQFIPRFLDHVVQIFREIQKRSKQLLVLACELYMVHTSHQLLSPRPLPASVPHPSHLSLFPSSWTSPIVHYLSPGYKCLLSHLSLPNTPQPGRSAIRAVQVTVSSCSKPPRDSSISESRGSQTQTCIRIIVCAS